MAERGEVDSTLCFSRCEITPVWCILWHFVPLCSRMTPPPLPGPEEVGAGNGLPRPGSSSTEGFFLKVCCFQWSFQVMQFLESCQNFGSALGDTQMVFLGGLKSFLLADMKIIVERFLVGGVHLGQMRQDGVSFYDGYRGRKLHWCNSATSKCPVWHFECKKIQKYASACCLAELLQKKRGDLSWMESYSGVPTKPTGFQSL